MPAAGVRVGDQPGAQRAGEPGVDRAGALRSGQGGELLGGLGEREVSDGVGRGDGVEAPPEDIGGAGHPHAPAPRTAAASSAPAAASGVMPHRAAVRNAARRSSTEAAGAEAAWSWVKASTATDRKAASRARSSPSDASPSAGVDDSATSSGRAGTPARAVASARTRVWPATGPGASGPRPVTSRIACARFSAPSPTVSLGRSPVSASVTDPDAWPAVSRTVQVHAGPPGSPARSSR